MDKFPLNIFTPIPDQICSVMWHSLSLSHMCFCISHTQVWPRVAEEEKYYYRQQMCKPNLFSNWIVSPKIFRASFLFFPQLQECKSWWASPEMRKIELLVFMPFIAQKHTHPFAKRWDTLHPIVSGIQGELASFMKLLGRIQQKFPVIIALSSRGITTRMANSWTMVCSYRWCSRPRNCFVRKLINEDLHSSSQLLKTGSQKQIKDFCKLMVVGLQVNCTA